jgi:hypothetical protein
MTGNSEKRELFRLSWPHQHNYRASSHGPGVPIPRSPQDGLEPGRGRGRSVAHELHGIVGAQARRQLRRSGRDDDRDVRVEVLTQELRPFRAGCPSASDGDNPSARRTADAETIPARLCATLDEADPGVPGIHAEIHGGPGSGDQSELALLGVGHGAYTPSSSGTSCRP